MGYKMIFSDMDGTLLHRSVKISAENVAAIKKARKKGVEFVICTGRGVFGVEHFLRELGLMGQKGYVICQNGATVYDLREMKPVLKESFSPAWIAPVADAAREKGLELFYYDDRRFMAERPTEQVRQYCEMMKTKMHILQNPMDYAGEFTKCLISGPRERLEWLKAQMLPMVQGRLDGFFSGETYLEFVRQGVNKGNALEATAKKSGISLADTIAIGDSDNDLSMILRAGMGVAVQNGEPHVKAAADYVTGRSCEENAVAEVIEKFVL